MSRGRCSSVSMSEHCSLPQKPQISALKERSYFKASSDVLSLEDLERLLQRRNFLLTPRHAVLEADANLHTRGLQLVEICQRGVQLLLRTLKILRRGRQCLLLVLFLRCLLLDILYLRRLVRLGVSHERVVLSLRRLLRRLRLRLQAREVGFDHLEHTDHAAVFGLHALVRRVENCRRLGTRLLLLEERRGLRGL